MAKRVATLLGVPAERLGVLPNPVEVGAFPPAHQRGRNTYELLWVGSIGEHKGMAVLLRALAILRVHRPHLHLRLIGAERATGDRARLNELAVSLGIGSAITYDGWRTAR